MADLSITAANVVAGAGSITKGKTANATITAGQVVYLDQTTGLVGLCDTDHATVQNRIAYGIALNGGASGQPIQVLIRGPITIGATMTAGVAYYASNTPGGISPVADVATERAIVLGMATSTAVLTVDIQDSGVTL